MLFPFVEKTPPSTQEFAHAETQDPSFPTANGPTPLLPKLGDSVYLCTHNGKKRLISLKRQPVVVLTRLSPCKIRSLLPPTLQNHDREDESSDTQWEPDEDSSDLDFSISSYNTGPNKRRKMDQKKEKRDKSPSTQQASANTGAKSSAAKTSTPQAKANSKAKSNTMKTSTPPANTNGNGHKIHTIQEYEHPYHFFLNMRKKYVILSPLLKVYLVIYMSFS